MLWLIVSIIYGRKKSYYNGYYIFYPNSELIVSDYTTVILVRENIANSHTDMNTNRVYINSINTTEILNYTDTLNMDEQLSSDETLESDDTSVSNETSRSEEYESPVLTRCVICLDARPQIGILHGDTLHNCMCISCSSAYQESECPVCRTQIERRIRVY